MGPLRLLPTARAARSRVSDRTRETIADLDSDLPDRAAEALEKLLRLKEALPRCVEAQEAWTGNRTAYLVWGLSLRFAASGGTMNKDQGTAGGSARREYGHRRAKDEQRIRQRWGRLGGIAVALSDEHQSTRAWSVGAVGEERVGARLDAIAAPTIRVLHDRRIPSTRANIDHLVVTPGGVWVVDSKRYKGRPELRVEGGILRARVEKLVVGGRDKTTLVEGIEWQVEQVRSAAGVIPVTGVLCFVEADWPLIGGSFALRGIEVLWPRKLVARLSASTGAVDVEATTAILAARFRSAT